MTKPQYLTSWEQNSKNGKFKHNISETCDPESHFRNLSNQLGEFDGDIYLLFLEIGPLNMLMRLFNECTSLQKPECSGVYFKLYFFPTWLKEDASWKLNSPKS